MEENENLRGMDNENRRLVKMENYRNPVVILGGSITALGMVRAFGKRGIDVYLIMDKKGIATFSKYCKKRFVAPRMGRERSTLKNLLTKIGKNLGRRAVVYPTSDLDALNLAELKEELPDNYHFVVGDKEPVEILVNKSRFYKALDRSARGISYPVTYFPQDLEDVRRIGTKLTYPVFIRPSITPLFSQIFGKGMKGFIAHSPRELTDYYRLVTRRGIEVMFQDIIPGPPSNSYQLEGYYDTNSLPTVLFARQRLRIWPPDFGNTTLCVSVPLTKLAKEKTMVNEFIRTIGYNGLMSAEFKEDTRDGILKFFEINARPWWHFWLSAKCGADIVYSSYLDAIGERTEYTEEYKTGVKSMYLTNDLLVFASAFLNGSLDFPGWLSSLRGVAQFADLEREDFSPFIMDCVGQVSSFLNRLLRKTSKAIEGKD